MVITYSIGHDVVAMPVSQDQADEHAQARKQAAALWCEIAERLDELEGMAIGSTPNLMRRLFEIHHHSPVAYRFVLQILHGDTSHLTESYRTRGDRRGKTKQDMHWEERQSIAVIKRHFPEVAEVMVKIRAQVEQHEERASKADLIRHAD